MLIPAQIEPRRVFPTAVSLELSRHGCIVQHGGVLGLAGGMAPIGSNSWRLLNQSIQISVAIRRPRSSTRIHPVDDLGLLEAADRLGESGVVKVAHAGTY